LSETGLDGFSQGDCGVESRASCKTACLSNLMKAQANKVPSPEILMKPYRLILPSDCLSLTMSLLEMKVVPTESWMEDTLEGN
jgi:hypothetical protein